MVFSNITENKLAFLFHSFLKEVLKHILTKLCQPEVDLLNGIRYCIASSKLNIFQYTEWN